MKKKFGRWTVLGFDTNNSKKYVCQCSCGSPPRSVRKQTLTEGRSKSCGCLRLEAVSKRPFESLYNRLVTHNVGVQVNLSYKEYLEFTKITAFHYCGGHVGWVSS